MDVEKLDDGQRQAIKTLPGLEAIQKELGEVKKVIEVYQPVAWHLVRRPNAICLGTRPTR